MRVQKEFKHIKKIKFSPLFFFPHSICPWFICCFLVLGYLSESQTEKTAEYLTAHHCTTSECTISGTDEEDTSLLSHEHTHTQAHTDTESLAHEENQNVECPGVNTLQHRTLQPPVSVLYSQERENGEVHHNCGQNLLCRIHNDSY